MLSREEDEGCQEVLVDLKDLLDATIDENGSNEGLEYISKNLRGLEKLRLSIIHVEVPAEGVLDELISILLIHEVLDLFLDFPLIKHPTLCGCLFGCGLLDLFVSHLPIPVEQDIPMEAKETDQLRQEVVLSEHTFGIVGIKWLEVFLSQVLLGQSLLHIVLLQNGVLDEV